MIYVTGDIHADQSRFKSKAMKPLKKGDTLVVCGDFGFIWDGSKTEQKALKWLGKRPYQILFVEGTHDNLDMLEEYPKDSFAGGTARRISGNIYQLLRGEIYHIEDADIFTFGGGESPDMDDRIEESHGNAVDYIITHSPSFVVNSFLDMDHMRTNQLGAFLDGVSRDVRYKQWYFGRCHFDKVIPPLHHAVYLDVLPLKV